MSEVQNLKTAQGRLLFEFVRHWSRRWHSDDDTRGQQGRLVLAAETVHTLTAFGSVTVNAVAQEIGIDQSGASRLIQDAAKAGFLNIKASSADTRRREVTVTESGRALLEAAHLWQQQIFESLTEDWTAQERKDFCGRLQQLVKRSRELE
eukprot:gene45310-61388_t